MTFIHAEDLLAKYPDLPRKTRETAILQEHPEVFVYGIGQSRTYMSILKKAHLGERDRTAGDPQGDVPRKKYSRAGIVTPWADVLQTCEDGMDRLA